MATGGHSPMAAGLLMGLAGVLGNGMDCDRLRIISSLLSSYQNIIMPFMGVYYFARGKGVIHIRIYIALTSNQRYASIYRIWSWYPGGTILQRKKRKCGSWSISLTKGLMTHDIESVSLVGQNRLFVELDLKTYALSQPKM